MDVTAEREHLVLDTSFVSVWSDVGSWRRAPWVDGILERVDAAELGISVVTIAELREGHLNARWGERRRRLATWRLHRCAQFPVDRRIAEDWSRIKVAGQRGGKTFGDNDLWIAATSKALGVPVVTCDRDFARMRDFGVRVVYALPEASRTR